MESESKQIISWVGGLGLSCDLRSGTPCMELRSRSSSKRLTLLDSFGQRPKLFVIWLDFVTYFHHHGHEAKLPWYPGMMLKNDESFLLLQQDLQACMRDLVATKTMLTEDSLGNKTLNIICSHDTE